MYPGFDNGPTETYMMPGTGPNPQLTIVRPPEEFDYIGNEVPPEVVYDQGLYYPAANYYGYICTGLDPQSEWNDHHRFFGLDGQELHYSGLQADSYPYVYYPPSYGYAQSSYNPYNPYIPGAVMGVDSPIIGTQQYFSNPSYQLPVPSPTNYMPVVVSPHSDAVPPSSVSPSLFGPGSSVPPSRHGGGGSKYSQPRVSSNGGTASQGAASRVSVSESSSQVSTDGRTSSGLIQVTDHFSHGSVSSAQNPSKGASSGPLPNYGTSARGWSTADRFRPKFQLNGTGRNANGSPDVLGEQNKGPRTNKSKGQFTSAISSQSSKACVDNTQEAIVIRADQYNKDCFSLDYPDAKFFVIKSYSEDDVHKSIKYNVWSSTPNGNKRLHSAYEDAQKRSCPIFLFFSVNASGQFCGVAEMIGQVDFHKDMDFWQQDKWTGSFPVKWHIIKDVPNTSFRHIVLENNENKPVTNSRDTQEITYIPGMNMLSIFKSSPLTTSILDDFMFYEERQKVMQEEKSRFSGSCFNSYIPAIVSHSDPAESPDKSVDNPEVGTQSVMSDQSLKAEADGNQYVDSLLTPNAIPASQRISDSEGLIIEPSNDKKDVNPERKEDDYIPTAINNMNSLSIDSKEGSIVTVVIEKSTQRDVSKGGSSETNVIEIGTKTNVVTVGTMHIKVNGTDEPTSKVV